ncbi:MAG: hypothetical protein JNG90_11345 [Planctomycetaceae bacterium]|nr:hypothetical protein [Planctomycetaceae bacterium]
MLRGVATATFAGLVLAVGCVPYTSAAAPVPGSSVPVPLVGDDFEDPNWSYDQRLPKNSADVDGRARNPGGRSLNGRWYEGTDRGQPDVVRRVSTPEGGLPGSTGSLLIASQFTGVPGKPDGKRAQDDLFLGVRERIGRSIPVSRSPSVVVRVFVPPLEEWEAATGSSFGFRTTVRGLNEKKKETEPYWPGMFFRLNAGGRSRPPVAQLVIRASEPGGDYTKMTIKETGWWTLGMSFSPDGRVHYFARPGVDDLTSADRIASHYPYGFQCTQFINVFFDVFNSNDGRRWSTNWVIDDPTVYASGAENLVRRPAPRGKTR